MTTLLRACTCAALILGSAAVFAQLPTQSTPRGVSAPADKAIKRTGFEVSGLQLAMGRESTKSLIPALQFHLETTLQGQEVGTLSCGLQIQGNPALRPLPCNLSWDGTEVRNLSLQYWGDRIVRINLLFNNYRFTNAQAELARVTERLSKRYGPPINGYQWQEAGETLWIDASLRTSSAMDILVLENTALAQSLADATRAEEDAQAAQWRQQRSRRSLQTPAPTPPPSTTPAETVTAPVATNAAGLP